MKLGFNLFGVEVTLIDTDVPAIEDVMRERWNALLDSDGDLTEEEHDETTSLPKGWCATQRVVSSDCGGAASPRR